jgi:hypothetical protein
MSWGETPVEGWGDESIYVLKKSSEGEHPTFTIQVHKILAAQEWGGSRSPSPRS